MPGEVVRRMASLIEEPYCQEFTVAYNTTMSIIQLLDYVRAFAPAYNKCEETDTGPSPSSKTFDHQLDIYLRKTVSVFMKTCAHCLSKAQINTVSSLK